jgi:RyR domain
MTDIDTVAAAIHETWRALSHTEGWSMQPRLDRPFAELDDEAKDDNRAAAARMGDVLAVAGLTLSDDPARSAAPLPEGLEAMAEAEHNGWMEHRERTGWSWAETRDDAAKRHPAMVPYAQLPEGEKEKDRSNVRHYPAFAERAGLRIVRAA